MKKIALIMCLFVLFAGCNKVEIPETKDLPQNQVIEPDLGENKLVEQDRQEKNVAKSKPKLELEEYTINKSGMTIKERYPAPKDYTRVEVGEKSFGEFLINQRLKPYGEKVLFYDGREKKSEGVYDSAFDVDIGDRDLHQCADAIMLLRAEYLYSHQRYDEISFDFVTGFKAAYKKWVEGYRIKVDGNNVSYYAGAEPSDSYEIFRKYMTMVMAYAGTLSLDKELTSVAIDDMAIGDVFIIGGSPGHAVIIVDMAINNVGEKIFLLGQSYMPAQQTQILINPMDEEMSPWYSLKGKEKLITPEWNFELGHLKRF